MLTVASRRFRAKCAPGLALVLLAASIGAAQYHPDWLEWHAPPTCPDAASGREAIAALRADGKLRRDARALVTLEPSSVGGWRARVVLSDRTGVSSREVEGASGARVADVAARVVALALDALAEREQGWQTSASAEAGRVVPPAESQRSRSATQPHAAAPDLTPDERILRTHCGREQQEVEHDMRPECRQDSCVHSMPSDRTIEGIVVPN